jgi:hypothetical protein
MPVRMPQVLFPTELQEEGPHQDPSILLGGVVKLDAMSYRIHAMRVNLANLGPDIRPDLEEDVYAECRILVIFDELIFLDNFDRSSALLLECGHYIFWMAPVSLESLIQEDLPER